MADQAEHPIAQVFTLEQHEHHQREDEHGLTRRSDERPHPAGGSRRGPLILRDHERSGGRARRRVAAAEIPLQLVQRALELRHRSTVAHAAQVGHLRLDVGAIGVHVSAEVGHLTDDAPTRQTEESEHNGDDQQYSRDLADPPLQPYDRRRQDKCEKNRQKDRNQDVLRPIKDGNHEDTTGERKPGGQLRAIVKHRRCYLSKARTVSRRRSPGRSGERPGW